MKISGLCLPIFVLVLSSLHLTHAAVPSGSEFDTSLIPGSGGLGGVATVRPQDPVSAIFANPATLTSLDGSNQFAIGITYGRLDLRADSGPIPGVTPGFDGRSNLDTVFLPHFAATHRFNEKFVGAIGITGLSGLGSDFRETPGLPGGGVISDLKLFGGAFSGAYQVNDQLSLGASLIMGLGSLQVGLFQSSATSNDFGFAGQFGATYDLGLIEVGAGFRTTLDIEYEDVVQTTATDIDDFTLEQPWQTMLGIATTDALWPNTFIAFEWRYKAYDEAEGYEDFWRDQDTFSLGIQHTNTFPFIGEVDLRAGWRYAGNLLKRSLDSNGVGDIQQIFIPELGVSAPVTPDIIRLFQVGAADGYWNHNASLGLGKKLSEKVKLDTYISYSFSSSDFDVGPINTDQDFLTIGAGLTWTIGADGAE